MHDRNLARECERAIQVDLRSDACDSEDVHDLTTRCSDTRR
jgi:hypothetical protein